MKRTNYIYILRYLATLLVGVVMLGCGKTPAPEDDGEDVWNPLTGDTPVRIRTSVTVPETKVTGTTFDNGDQIGIFGFYHNGSGSTDGSWAAETSADTNVPDYMYNQLMVYNSSTEAWDYTPIKYWPNEHGSSATSAHIDKLSFWGYYPYGGSGISFRAHGTSTTYTNATAGLPDVYFVANGYTDLMTSDLRSDLYKGMDKGVSDHYGSVTDGEVDLNFTHRLSLITLQAQKAEGEESTVKIHSLELRSVKSEGTFSTIWSLEDATLDYVAVSSVDGTAIGVAPYPSLLRELLLLPQELEDDVQQFYIDYSVDDDPVHVENTIDIRDTGTDEWEIGYHYVYTFTINGKSLDLTLELQPWEYHSFTYSGIMTPHVAWSGTRLAVDGENGIVQMDNWAPAHCKFDFGSGSEWMATLVGDGDFAFCLEDGTALYDSKPLPDGSGNYSVWSTLQTGTLSYELDGTPIPETLHVTTIDNATILKHEALLRFYLRSREGDWQLVRMTSIDDTWYSNLPEKWYPTAGWGFSVYECKLIQNDK